MGSLYGGRFTMDSAVLGLASSGCLFMGSLYGGRFSTEIYTRGCHGAWSAAMRVTNEISLGCSLLLPVDSVNCVQTLKVPLPPAAPLLSLPTATKSVRVTGAYSLPAAAAAGWPSALKGLQISGVNVGDRCFFC
jgi:hypothetical protein